MTRILAIDDERAILRAIRRALHPCTVDLAADGSAAISLLAAGNVFDAIVCDLNLEGMTGIEVWNTLARTFPGMEQRIVFLTGGCSDPHTCAALKQIGQPVVGKPFSQEELIGALRRVADVMSAA